MKRTTCLLLMLCFSFFLEAAVVMRSSNSIGQDRGPYRDDSEYHLLLDGDTTWLYHADTPLWSQVKRQDGDDFVSTKTFFEGDGTTRTETKSYSGSKLMQSVAGSIITEYSYTDDGTLWKIQVTKDGMLDHLSFFYHGGADHALTGIRTVRAATQTGQLFGRDSGTDWHTVFSDVQGTKTTRYANGIVVVDTWKGEEGIPEGDTVFADEGGRLVVSSTEDGVVRNRTYDERGRIVVETDDEGTTSYGYDEEGNTVSSLFDDGKGLQVHTAYDRGTRRTSVTTRSGTIEKQVRFLEAGGRIETLFEKGTPYCDVTYDTDGRTILSIEYR